MGVHAQDVNPFVLENYSESKKAITDSTPEKDEESRLLSLEDMCLSCRESPSEVTFQCGHTYCRQCNTLIGEI